jgi:hypothetical protein
MHAAINQCRKPLPYPVKQVLVSPELKHSWLSPTSTGQNQRLGIVASLSLLKALDRAPAQACNPHHQTPGEWLSTGNLTTAPALHSLQPAAGTARNEGALMAKPPSNHHND